MANDAQTATRTRNRRAEITDDVDAGVVTFKFMDGGPPLVCDVTKLPAAIQRRCVVSRVHNKLMDSYADPATEPRHEASGVWAEMLAGTWSQRGEAGPKRPTLLIEALAELYKADLFKKDPDAARAAVERFLEEQGEEAAAAFKKKTFLDESGKICTNPVYVRIEELKARRAREKAAALKKSVTGISLGAINIPD